MHPLPFELWRQDDHGRHFLIGRHPTLDAAERQLAELTRALHKQSYWIVECSHRTIDKLHN